MERDMEDLEAKDRRGPDFRKGAIIFGMCGVYCAAIAINEALIQTKRGLGTVIGRRYARVKPGDETSFAYYERTR